MKRQPQLRAELMTLRDLADHFRVSINTAKKLPISFTKIGRQRRYHPELVKRYEVMHASSVKGALDWKEVA